jgi:hypothetical protein
VPKLYEQLSGKWNMLADVLWQYGA